MQESATQSATEEHHDFLNLSIPYCGRKTDRDSIKIKPNEKKIANTINQLISNNKASDHEIYVMNRRYTSVHAVNEINDNHGDADIVGCVQKNRTCLLKSFYN